MTVFKGRYERAKLPPQRIRILFQQYLHHIYSDSFLLSCSAVMLVLFGIDLLGVIGKRIGLSKLKHYDFATTIVSIGLFATFFGVLTGLYGFDSNNIAGSVPQLLEGLRFAFAASVMGMFLSLTLSIAHKFHGGGADDGEILHSIDSKMGALVTTFQSPAELVRQFTDMKSFLKSQLEQINVSLDKALGQLARGATQEVIQALEGIIQEFNQNLTAQFGDNFKQLNAACLTLVDWQKKYKDHIDITEKTLTKIMRSLEDSCKAAQELTKGNEKTQEICQAVADLIRTYDFQVRTLSTHLESCKNLGEQAGKFLSSTQKAITLSAENLNNFSGIIEESVGKQSESLARLTQDIDDQLPRALGELERVLTNITNQFAADYRSLFQFITDKQ